MTTPSFSGQIDSQQAVDEFNANFAFTVVGGRARIAEPKCWDPSLERYFVRFLPLADFKQMFANWRIGVPAGKGRTKLVPIAELWLSSPHRRQHLGGIVCDPTNRANQRYLNVWQGLAVEPKPGNCQIILDHIEHIICRGDAEIFDYAISWLATKVQRPGEPPETAFVMRGGRGVGKGFLGHIMRRLFGVHGMFITQAEHLVGKFNTHLLNCCLLFADEAFYAGDKRHEKVLNALITEPTIVIEKKGVDAFQARNHLGIIMATNANWAVAAAADERRYFVVDVSDAHQGDRDYFARLWGAASNPDVLAAFLHELMQYDLNGFDIRNIPQTEGLNDQKIASLGDFESWLLGHLFAERGLDPDPKVHAPWSEEWSTTAAYEQFEAWTQRKGTSRFAPNISTFGKSMKRFFGEPIRPRGTATRQRRYVLGTIEEARKRFCEVQKVEIEWTD